MRRVWYPGHLSRAIGIGGLCLVISGAAVIGGIRKLSAAQPHAQISVQKECGSMQANQTAKGGAS